MVENLEKITPPSNTLMHDHYDDEIDLTDILNVLWKQRWFIVIVTLSFVTFAIVYVFVKTPLYEIKARISPGITDYDKNGNSIRKVSPNDITAWFSEKLYCSIITEEKNKCPEIDAKLISKTDSVTVSYYSNDPIQAKNTLNNILNILTSGGAQSFKRELIVGKKSLEYQIHEAKQSIKQLLIEQDWLKKFEKIKINNKIDQINSKLESLKNRIDSNRKNRTDNQNAVESTRRKIDIVNRNTEEVMALQEQMISDGSDKMTSLMYSNFIQQNLSYVNNLQIQNLNLNKEVNDSIDEESERSEKVENLQTQISDLKLERDTTLALREKELKLDIERAEEKFEILKTKQDSLSIVDIADPPTSSQEPVKPKKLIIVLLSFVIGFIFSVLTSFIRNFWKINKLQIKANGKTVDSSPK